MNEIKIREITANELNLLEDLLYEAVYQSDETNLIPREVVNVPQIRVYIDKFGQKKDDYCLVADLNSKIIGGVWIRILADEIRGFGNIDDKTPEFAISLFKEYRNCGIGTQLMREMIEYLKTKSYKQVSLSVQKANYAVKMYKKTGFQIIEENEEEYIMLLKLNEYPID
ncbi:MAG: GNAT family N-acetyltransferase [Prevotellaceae bacterium]|jgi:ribosomal protein S18 acetylase RimI-like enzyme|nr:GNAT family N-acetyltransferase [Prevotellaceae bacterium]